MIQSTTETNFYGEGFCFLLLLMMVSLLFGCKDTKNKKALFEYMEPAHTSIHFSNTVTQSPDFNIINYLYFYDGGGVSIGDINNDGLPDIYFTANMDSNRLYLNEGNFEFSDITSQSGVAGSGEWTTGTTMADVNGDGFLDIYVCNVNYKSKEGRNLLFINNGDSTFSEQAEQYGLDFRGYSKQAAFFDMENDGDLDMYLLNHAIHTKDSFRPSDQRSIKSDKAGDRLYRNDGGVFTDVTEEAGIHSSVLGYGLGVTVSDLNGDHYSDIYISNDFHENDYLYINKGDGTFRDVLEQSISHTSRASMGNDIGDINNDLMPDIAVVDMLPSTERGLKTAVSSEPYEVYSIQREYGYHPQLIRNTLQLNLGEPSDSVPVFADIAPMAGVEATDWSWSPLFFDMDNDGWKDLFISNGIYRRPNDMDYLSMVKSDKMQRSLEGGVTEKNISVIDSMPKVKIPNMAYRNDGNLGFTDKSQEWGLGKPSYSSGTSYGDLDNDGDLDLVINNVNSRASIYRNRTTEEDSTSYLTIRLKGQKNNTQAVGSKVIAYNGKKTQLAQLSLTRGFQSSVDPRLFFGFGDATCVDSLKIIWPDGSELLKRDISVNQQLTIKQAETKERSKRGEKSKKGGPPVTKVPSPLSPAFKHNENNFNGFQEQPLMPYQLSQMGPGMAAGDVNNDGLDDLYIGGARHQEGALFFQRDNGEFSKQSVQALKRDSLYEDTDAAFFDADNDGYLDLYVVSGGNEQYGNGNDLRDRLYLNNGQGDFIPAPNAIPEIKSNGSVAVPFDYDGDGDRDLFVGSRSIPGSYGAIPSSYLLENRGDGTFMDVTADRAPDLGSVGMVSDAGAADLNRDGAPDLVVAGEWMPVSIFLNKDGGMQKLRYFKTNAGLWQGVHLADIDNDGDQDILAGNMGLNTTLKASPEQPLVMYLKDFNEDGSSDPIIGQTKGDKVYPVAPRDHLLKPFFFLRSKFPTYDSYAEKSITEIFGSTRLAGATRKEVTGLASVYIENKGDNEFEIHELPKQAQLAPIFDFYSRDFNADGYREVIMGGNLYQVQPLYGGRYDASQGWYFEGQENGFRASTDVATNALYIEGEIRGLVEIGGADNKKLIIVGINNKAPVFLK